jgi:hypothetical protein
MASNPSRASLLACAAALLVGCATAAPDAPNPEGLAPDALSLDFVLAQGCLPYVAGEKTESQAMADVGLRRVSTWNPITPSGPDHQYIGRYPGVSAVNLHRGHCTVHARGANTAGYRRAVEAVLARRFGADYLEGQPAAKPIIPGQIQFCLKGLYVTYYADPPRSIVYPGYDVEAHVFDCAKWREQVAAAVARGESR